MEQPSNADIYHRLGAIEVKVDQALSLEDRVVKVETTVNRWKVYSQMALVPIGGAATLAFAYLKEKIKLLS